MQKVITYIGSFILGGFVFGGITGFLLQNYYEQGYKYLEVSEGTRFIDTNVSLLKLSDKELRCRLASLTLFESRRLEEKMPKKSEYLMPIAAHEIYRELLDINLKYISDNDISEMSLDCK